MNADPQYPLFCGYLAESDGREILIKGGRMTAT